MTPNEKEVSLTAIPAVPSEPPFTDEAALSDADYDLSDERIAALKVAIGMRDVLSEDIEYLTAAYALASIASGADPKNEAKDKRATALGDLIEVLHLRLVASLRTAREELNISRNIRESWERDYEKLRAEVLRGADREAERGHELVALREELMSARAERVELIVERDQARRGIATYVDAVHAALGAALGDRWSPDRPPAAGVQQLAEERDQALAELAKRTAERNKALGWLGIDVADFEEGNHG